MTFAEALPEIIAGGRLTREKWRLPSRFVTIDRNEIVEVRDRKDFGGEPIPRPYRPVNSDMLATDWMKVEDLPAQEKPTEETAE